MSTATSHAPVRRGSHAILTFRYRLRAFLLVSGIGASLLYLAALVLGPLQWAGYSSIDQTVSELFAVDAPSRPLVGSLLWVHGLLALGFGIGVTWAGNEGRALRVAGWCLLGVGLADQAGPFFPMHTREVVAAGGGTYSDTVHIVITMVLSLLILVAMGFGAAAFGNRFRVYSIVTMATLILFGGFASMQAGALAANEPTPGQGIYERVNIGAYLLWMGVLAALLLRRGVASGRTRAEA